MLRIKGDDVAIVEAEELRAWAARLMEAWGYAPADAAFVADSLVDANLRGVDSHGVIRLPIYSERIRNGLVDPRATPKIVTTGGVVAVDANSASGQIAARDAVAALVAASRKNGVATAVVRGSAHFGAAGYYARMLADQGQVAFVVSNSEPIVVPFGGKSALLGTNPLAFAAPTGSAALSLDMATSTVAMGKVMVAASRHEPIPADWGVDANGQPTTDPDAVVALLPVGGPKGYGLGMIVEVLGGVLSGASVAHNLGNMYSDMGRQQDIGHWMLAMNIESFMPPKTFGDRMDGLVDMVRATPPQDEKRPVLMPGEPEDIIGAARSRDGVPLPDDTIAELSQLSEKFDVPLFVEKNVTEKNAAEQK